MPGFSDLKKSDQDKWDQNKLRIISIINITYKLYNSVAKQTENF